MRNDRHVLFGDDGSPGADLAWLWVHEQRWPGWELLQLRAAPPPMGQVVAHDRSAAHPDPDGPRRTSFAEAGFVRRHAMVAEADPRVVLTETPAALVVVGATGEHFGPDRFGSTADWLVRHGPTPTLTARAGSTVERVLVAADGSDPSLRAIGALVELPWCGGLVVTAIAVDDGSTDTDAALAATRAVLEDRVGDLQELVKPGRPTPLLLDAAESAGADLVVLGTRGHGGFERLVLGSTATAVVRHARASVLTAR